MSWLTLPLSTNATPPESLFDLKRIRVNNQGNNIYDEWEEFEDCDLIKNDAGRKVRLCESDKGWATNMGNGRYDKRENFTDDKGNVEIGLKLPLSEKTLKAMLTKIYILPARIFNFCKWIIWGFSWLIN